MNEEERMEFPKDEVKNKIVWTKGADFTDGSPRYTFEGRDPATTYERFQVVIYTERERRYAHDPEASVITIMVMCVTTEWNVPKPSDRTILSGGKAENAGIVQFVYAAIRQSRIRQCHIGISGSRT